MAKKQTIQTGVTISSIPSISSTSGQTLVYNSNSTTQQKCITFASPKRTYHVLDEDVEVVSSYIDIGLVTNIAILNVLGKPFLDELHKNGTFFPTEIEEYLEKKFKLMERDKKIDDIIN
jgi:hypothetical protein